MHVFLTGATGYIGTAVAEALKSRGHSVAGLARSDEAARKLEGRGTGVERGDVREPATVATAARRADAVIHTALPNTPDAGQVDLALVEAVLDTLAGTEKPFVYTSGIWVHGSTGDRVADEDTPLAPTPLVAWRPGVERLVLEAAARGARGSVIRPAMVYGRGGGIVASFVASARENGAVRVVGDGRNRWPWVHVNDLADLYTRLLDAPAGTVVLASDGPSIPVRDVAAAASRRAGAGGKVEFWPLEEARPSLGAYADALTLDQQVSSRRAREKFGWKPVAPSVLAELGAS